MIAPGEAWSSESDSSEYEDYDTTRQKKMMGMVQEIFWNEKDACHEPDGTGRREFVEMCRQVRNPPLMSLIQQLGTENIDMQSSGLRPKDIIALGHAIKFNSITKRINLQGNIFSGVGGVPFFQNLCGNVTVREMCLAECRLSRECGIVLAETLPSLMTLTSLDLSGNGITDITGSVLALSVKEHPALKYFNFSKNNLGMRTAEALAFAIRGNSNLVDVDVSWNHWRAPAMKIILDAVSVNASLKVLSLGWNCFGLEGTEALANLISRNSTLTQLDISSAKIHPSLTLKLSDSLKSNKSLKMILMDSNPLGPDAEAVNHTLKNHKTVTSFSLNNSNTIARPLGQAEFDDVNPAGHYLLDLSNVKERKVAQKLSQLGAQYMGECVRNASLDGNKFDFPKDYMWATPNVGVLEVDLVVLDPPEGEPMSDEDFTTFMNSLTKNVTDTSKMVLLRNAATAYFFSAMQGLSIIQMFSFDREKENAIVVLFCRVVDRHSFTLLLSHAISPESRMTLMKRLGPEMIINRINLNGNYVFDLAKDTDRKILKELWDKGEYRIFHGMDKVRLNGSPWPPPDIFADFPPTGSLEFYFNLPKTEQEKALGRALGGAIENFNLQKIKESKRAPVVEEIKDEPIPSWNPFHSHRSQGSIGVTESRTQRSSQGDLLETERSIVSVKERVGEETRRTSSIAAVGISKISGSGTPSASNSRPTSASTRRSRPPSHTTPKGFTSATQARISRKNSAENILIVGPPPPLQPTSPHSDVHNLEYEPAINQVVKNRHRTSNSHHTSRTSSGRSTRASTPTHASHIKSLPSQAEASASPSHVSRQSSPPSHISAHVSSQHSPSSSSLPRAHRAPSSPPSRPSLPSPASGLSNLSHVDLPPPTAQK